MARIHTPINTNTHISSTCKPLDNPHIVHEMRLGACRSAADPAHILRRKCQRTANADALVALGVAVEWVNPNGSTREPGVSVARPSVGNLVVSLLLGSTEIEEETTVGHLTLVAVGYRGIRGAALGAALDRVVDGGTRGKGRLEGEVDAARGG